MSGNSIFKAGSSLFASILIGLVFIGPWETIAQADDKATIFQAKALLDNGQAKGAYRLLLPLESEYAGNPEFDYLLGISALDADVPNYAVIALQRVLAMEPAFVGARVDLARSYYYLGEFSTAREEFEAIMQYNPPNKVRELVVFYLDEIFQRQKGPRYRVSYALDAAFGSDSNANSATDLTTYKDFALSEQARKSPSAYGLGGLTANLAFQAGARSTFYMGADIHYRYNVSAPFVNNTIASGNMSVNYFDRYFSMNVGAKGFYSRIGEYESYTGMATGRLQFSLSRLLKATFMGRAGGSEFFEELSTQDNFNGLAGVGLSTVQDIGILPKTNLMWIYGRSYARHRDSSEYDNETRGLRASGTKHLTAKWRLVGAGGAIWTRYLNLFQGVPREERRLDAMVGVEWKATKRTLIKAGVSYIYNSSTQAIYAYDKLDYNIGLRREF
ncbi:MAG: hypothetical protein OEZ43_10670 [Gammaproteobacteria bacterium]|nr:hypothetical protein [Gammaproteobacteria bacterium]